MQNHNKLLGKVAGVDGLKTGFTEGAGYCLSATAERNGRRVIVVIMGAFGPGGQKDLGKARDLKAVELLERGFAAQPAAMPVAKPSAPGAAVATQTADLPVVKTDKTPAPVADPASTDKDPVVTFRVIPPEKKP